jgi:hypothetical protein
MLPTEKPTLVVWDKADDAVDTGCIDKESNAVPGREGAVSRKDICETGH